MIYAFRAAAPKFLLYSVNPGFLFDSTFMVGYIDSLPRGGAVW